MPPEKGPLFTDVVMKLSVLRFMLKSMSKREHAQQVSVDWHKRDRYSRLVGRVLAHGKGANLAHIEAGLAWHYVAYASEQAPDDRKAYGDAHRAAHTPGWGSGPTESQSHHGNGGARRA